MAMLTMLSMLLLSHVRFTRELLLHGERAAPVVLGRMKYGYCLEVTCGKCRYIFDVVFTRKAFDGRDNPQPDRRNLSRLEGDR